MDAVQTSMKSVQHFFKYIFHEFDIKKMFCIKNNEIGSCFKGEVQAVGVDTRLIDMENFVAAIETAKVNFLINQTFFNKSEYI